MYAALMPSRGYYDSSIEVPTKREIKFTKRKIKFTKSMILKFHKSIEILANDVLKKSKDITALHSQVAFYHEVLIPKLDPVHHTDIISSALSSYPATSKKLKSVSDKLCSQEPRACEIQDINIKIFQKLNSKANSIPVTTSKSNKN